ncbi:ABC transporter ATP-binding protein [Planctomycetaceae bacterium SCGC AG-212-F19]|nr:ABC transporter ATP-binding protein [Planctomycetaceae bacterium SCGC AG-212-F19]
MPLLEVKGLVKYYGRRKVVDGIDFEVHAGEVVGLLGPNGAGKTTSFRMTTGLIAPFDGQVAFNGQDVTQLPMYRRARLGMGYLSQEKSVFRNLTVEQNVLAILEMLPASRSLGRRLSKRERIQRTDDVLAQFGLSRLRKNNAGRLSGGETRRLEIARCLVCEPLLILLDEPFTGIDPKTIADIQQIVADLRRQGIGILLTDHNVREALKITDRSYIIKDGKVQTHGTPFEIVHDSIAIAEYLGTSFADGGIGGPVGAAPAVKPPEEVVHLVLEQEKIHRQIERLKSAEGAEAAAELVEVGRQAIPSLLDALTRRDVEMRRLAFAVLQTIVPGAVFDPYAPEAQRRQQIADLRDRSERKAG